MRTEESCGAVVFTHKDRQLLYVIIKSTEGYYGFPKGHIELNETEEQTALREIFEETGVRSAIIPGFKTIEEHPIPNKDVMKRVTYFASTYEDQELHFQREELLGAYLLTFEEAMSRLQFENSRKILSEAHSFIQSYLSRAHIGL